MTMSSSRILSSRPGSARTPRRSYKVISPRSEVDELLFTSHNTLSKDDKFDPRWKPLESKEKSQRPLLWTPTPNTEKKTVPKTPLKKKHNRIKLLPSFVDETLFGPQIKEPDFPAPWESETKKNLLLWSPSKMSISKEDQKMSNTNLRCNTPNSARKSKPLKPVWKP